MKSATCLAVLASMAQTSLAFKDASPFFLFSNVRLNTRTFPDTRVASSASIRSHLTSALECGAVDTVVTVEQHGVSADDFVHASTPHLQRSLTRQAASSVVVPDVLGAVKPLSDCGAVERLDGSSGVLPHFDTKPKSIHLTFPSPPASKEARQETLQRYDSYLNDVISSLDSYAVVYITHPGQAQECDEPEYEMDDVYSTSLHTGRKRDYSPLSRAYSTSTADVALFEKYQFLSSGLFMGITVSLLLFSILYVAVSAVSSVEVSYMAFSKEMGPAAQRKQQ